MADVGGGTTDLTLVGVREDHGELVLERLASRSALVRRAVAKGRGGLGVGWGYGLSGRHSRCTSFPVRTQEVAAIGPPTGSRRK